MSRHITTVERMDNGTFRAVERMEGDLIKVLTTGNAIDCAKYAKAAAKTYGATYVRGDHEVDPADLDPERAWDW